MTVTVELERHEARIERVERDYTTVRGLLLKKIRDKRLYRPDHPSFEPDQGEDPMPQGLPWYTYETTVDQHHYQVELTVYGDPISVRREHRTCWWRFADFVRRRGRR
jgi:hypothetical protein